MISTKIKSGDGTGNEAVVGSEGTLQVVIHPHPPIVETINTLPFSQFFTTTGDSTGSQDMIVNGATTPIKFFIRASDDFDIYISSITVQISDPGATLDKFGAIAELTNGVRFFYDSPRTGNYDLASNIRTNLDFFRDATAGKGFGTGVESWRADVQGGAGLDSYFPEINLTQRYGLEWGLKIAKGSKAILGYEVRDNLAGLSIFDIKGYGIRL